MLANFIINIFNRAATGSRRVRIALTPIGPVFFLGVLILLVTVSLYLDRRLGFKGFLPSFLRIPAAVLLLVSGMLLVIWSISSFLMVRGTPVPFNPPPVLVDTGPYALSRNPMLAGVFLLLLGIGTSLGSVSLTFIITPLFILLMVLELKAVEEPELVKRLGQEYLCYREKVPMFFPKIRRGSKSGKPL